MVDKVIIAGVQMDPKIGEKRHNVDKAIDFCREAHNNGAKIVIFPECALTGYCFSDLQEAVSISEPVPGPSTESMQKICRELDILALFGLIEKADDKYYNVATLVGSEGVIGNFRKIHLPFLGVDQFVNKGDTPFTVYDTKYGKLGWVICYDGSFPESIRTLTLKGVEIAILLTNWPDGDEPIPNYIIPARAIENHINYIAVNRVGKERGVHFIGMSRIVDPSGNILAQENTDKETIIYAEVDLEKARNKNIVVIPGVYEMNRIKDRRPEFYGSLIDPSPVD